jgi:signal transduction histidine kinase
MIIIYILNRKGKVLLSASIFLVVLTFSIFAADAPATMVSGLNLFFFVLPIMIASMVIRPYASFIAAALVSVLIVVVSVVLKIPGDLIIGPLGFSAIALVSWLSARSLENALAELRVTNQELDERVIKRTQELAEVNSHLEEQTTELSEANDRLRDLDRLKSKFVSDVAHELRTPINNIAIYVEMMLYGRVERQPQYLKIIQDETTRLSALITSILDLSRMENGTTKITLGWIDVKDLCGQVVTANLLQAEAKGLNLLYKPGWGLPPIWVDRNQINQVMHNLIANAINYTPEGSIEVSTFQEPDSDFVSIEVKDTGMGIYPDDMTHIFERFYRGRQTSQSNLPGTGLGLAITKELVESLGGRISVSSQPEKGSTFTVQLPTRQAIPVEEK